MSLIFIKLWVDKQNRGQKQTKIKWSGQQKKGRKETGMLGCCSVQAEFRSGLRMTLDLDVTVMPVQFRFKRNISIQSSDIQTKTNRLTKIYSEVQWMLRTQDRVWKHTGVSWLCLIIELKQLSPLSLLLICKWETMPSTRTFKSHLQLTHITQGLAFYMEHIAECEHLPVH